MGMGESRSTRPSLRLVEGSAPHFVEWAWFCGHCAAPSPGNTPPAPTSRVCRSCGLGLLLETRQDVLPSDRDAFLFVDTALLVQGMSRRAQVLLGTCEEDAVNRQVIDFLVPADAEAQGGSAFAAAIADATAGAETPVSAFVRPWNTFGIRMRARVAPCGPPRAALVVLQSGRERRLRVVS
jgi:hypothetical protein